MTDNNLRDHLIRLIRETGPLPLSHYMALCLGHREHGYYMTRDPLGAKGDFTTAPEVSQMFGELVGLWLADCWLSSGAPKPFVLAELGPGRGTLMADALRALRAVPGMTEAASIHFVETSPALRAAQRERVQQAQWHSAVGELPEGPLFLIANEFFDALPVTQYQRTERGWCERCVDYQEGRFVPVLAPVPVAHDLILAPALHRAPPGSIAEICPPATAITGEIASRIAATGGAALIIDYGYVKSAPGDTLQALRRHAFADPFDTPGEADLTTHVDFEALSHAARAAGATPHGPVEQGAFLNVLGIGARAERLMRDATERQKRDIESALVRLTHPREMGSLFKVLAITPPDAGIPAGFA